MMIGNNRGNLIIGSVSEAIKALFDYLTLREKTKPTRDMKKAIEYGERYIRRSKEVYDIQDDDLKKWEEKFYKHN